MLTAAVIFTGLALIGTKFADCWTTAKRLVWIGQEANPLARFLMKRLGVGPTLWGVFVLVTALVSAVTIWVLWTVRHESDPLYREAVLWCFIGTGLFVSLVQAGVAFGNWTRRPNLITRPIAFGFRILSRILGWFRGKGPL